MTATMTAVVQRDYGPPEVLVPATVPVPVPPEGHLLVRVGAVSATTADAAFRSGEPVYARLVTGLRRPRRPVLGSELAGEVVGLGPEVEGFTVGDRVITATGVEMGGYAELAAAPATAALRIQDDVSDRDAVALVEGGLTALPFLRDHGRVGPGTRVLVNGASGAVGSAAVQIAAHLGAVVTGVCSGPNAELVRRLGASTVIDHTATDLDAVDLGSIGGPYDVVFDAVGKSSYGRCRRLLTGDGRYLTTVPSLGILVLSLWTRWFGRRTARIAFTGLRKDAAKVADTAYLLDLARAGALVPVVDGVLALSDAEQAHRRIDTGHKVGVVVLVPDPDQGRSPVTDQG